MAYDVNATFSEEQALVENVEPIDMYIVNASQSGWDAKYYVNYNQDIYEF